MKKKNAIKGIIVIALLFAMAVGVAVGLSACGKKVNEMEVVETLIEGGTEDVMLFDYFRRVVGTEEEQGYYEIVLYAIRDEEGKMSTEEARMDVYTDGGLRSEKLTSHTISYEVFEKAMEVAKEYEMAEWKDNEETFPIDGCIYVCKFPNGTEYCRVSSEEMPENGMEAFNAVLDALTVNP